MLHKGIRVVLVLICLFFFDTYSLGYDNSFQTSESKMLNFRQTGQLDSLTIYSDRALVEIFENEDIPDSLSLRYISHLLYSKQHEMALKHLLLLTESPELSENNKAHMYSSLGELFFDIRAFELSAEHYKKAVNSVEARKQPVSFYWVGYIGASYLHLERYDSAIAYFKKQYQFINETAFHEKALALNNIGLSYQRMGDNKEAIKFYERAMKAFQLRELSNYDSLLIATIYDNLGDAYLERKDTSRALFYSIENKNGYFKALHNDNDKIEMIENYLDILISRKDQKVFELIDSINAFQNLSLENQLLFSKMKINGLLAFGKSVPKTWFDTMGIIQDSILIRSGENERIGYNITSSYILKHAELQSALMKSQLTEEKMKEQQLKRMVALTVIITLLIIILIMVYFRYRRKKDNYEKIILNEKKLNLENTLKLKEQDITNFAINLNLKQEQKESLITELEQIRSSETETSKEKINDLIRQLKSSSVHKKSLELLNNNVHEINAEFYQKLREHLPQITDQEKEICAFVRLGLNNKEIASIRDISPNSAKVAKYRLKKKLGLSEEEDLFEFLQKL